MTKLTLPPTLAAAAALRRPHAKWPHAKWKDRHKSEAPEAQRQDIETKVFTPAELAQLFATADHVLIIDARTPEEIKQVGGFPVYLGIQPAELENSLPWLPHERTIVTVSNDGVRGRQVAEILTRNGFQVAGTIAVRSFLQRGGKLTRAPRPCWLSGPEKAIEEPAWAENRLA
jgi:rhodanese-related sulfurtransferase